MAEPDVFWWAERRAAKDAVLAGAARALGRSRPLYAPPLSVLDFDDTAVVVAACLARAKRAPTSAFGRSSKRTFLTAVYNGARRHFAGRPDVTALCWNGLTGTRRAFMEGARAAGAKTLYAELAPFAGFVTLDPAGVNAEGSVPRHAADFETVTADPDLLAATRDGFTARSARRSDVGQGAGHLDDMTAPFLFVPLQVPNDSQMRLFSGWVRTVEGFVDALAQASSHLPAGWHFRLKEHPSSKQAVTARIRAAIAAGARIVLDNATDSFAQLRASRGVVTVNSSMGLQAMFFDKPVLATGTAFWNRPGLCAQADDATGLATACADFGQVRHDHTDRARFLTWLLTRYYVPWDGSHLDETRLLHRVAS